MSGDESAETETPEQSDEGNEDTKTKMSDLSDEGRKEVEQMQAAYNDDRQTAVLPGTDGTITGVAVNEWIDEDGNPKFGKDEQSEKDDEQDKPQDGDRQHEDAS